ncbi:MAG TPA: isoprenyl transferase [Candidatus Obscuribacterales bacterium]
MPKIAKAHTKSESERKSAGAAESLPLKHVAIIMDGNRRWADKHGLPRFFGHKEGVKALKRLVKHVTARKLEYLTVYAFSSENWQRGHDEVDYLMQLFNEVLKTELDELAKAGARLRFIGDLQHMPAELQQGLNSAMEKTRTNSGLHLQVALNYGSRLEITTAVKRLVADVQLGKVNEPDITPELLSKYLYTGDIPDPDLMIRTGGEMRLSNYLLWQSAYTELYVTPIMWPEFQPKHFDEAVASFEVRQRRYGGD